MKKYIFSVVFILAILLYEIMDIKTTVRIYQQQIRQVLWQYNEKCAKFCAEHLKMCIISVENYHNPFDIDKINHIIPGKNITGNFLLSNLFDNYGNWKIYLPEKNISYKLNSLNKYYCTNRTSDFEFNVNCYNFDDELIDECNCKVRVPFTFNEFILNMILDLPGLIASYILFISILFCIL